MKIDRSNLYDYSNGQQFKGKSAIKIFTEIADKNFWIEKESVSGFGSSLEQTGEIIQQLPGILGKFDIKTMLDAPCGDFNWMQKVDLTNIEYTGADIVEKIVAANNQKFKADTLNFIQLNLINDSLDHFDLIFCRDCLVHLSFTDIQKVLNNIKQSSITYLMTTTFPGQETNIDIQTGGWRPLNFENEPFHFPKPSYLLNEKCTEMDGAFKDKSLGLWEVKNLKMLK